MVEPHHFYVMSLPEMYIYININTAGETCNHNTENDCRQQAVRCHDSGQDSPERTIKKQRRSLKDSIGLSHSQIWGFLYLYSAGLVNPCGFMLLGECGGTQAVYSQS